MCLIAHTPRRLAPKRPGKTPLLISFFPKDNAEDNRQREKNVFHDLKGTYAAHSVVKNNGNLLFHFSFIPHRRYLMYRLDRRLTNSV